MNDATLQHMDESASDLKPVLRELRRQKHKARGALAGRAALASRQAAGNLYHGGGHRLLGKVGRRWTRDASEHCAAAGSLVMEYGPSPSSAGELLADGVRTAVPVSRELMLSSVKTVAVNAGRAAGMGMLVDGGLTAVVQTIHYARGRTTAAKAVKKVIREAGTGGVATAAGTLATVAVVVVTGPVSGPVMFMIAAGATTAVKLGLTKLLSRRSS